MCRRRISRQRVGPVMYSIEGSPLGVGARWHPRWLRLCVNALAERGQICRVIRLRDAIIAAMFGVFEVEHRAFRMPTDEPRWANGQGINSRLCAIGQDHRVQQRGLLSVCPLRGGAMAHQNGISSSGSGRVCTSTRASGRVVEGSANRQVLTVTSTRRRTSTANGVSQPPSGVVT